MLGPCPPKNPRCSRPYPVSPDGGGCNNHLHVNILPRDAQDYRRGGELFAQWAAEVTAMGGAVSAEHGVGKIKAGFLETMYGHEAMVESARLKLQLDPDGQLGRGNLFSEKLLDELVQKGGA